MVGGTAGHQPPSDLLTEHGELDHAQAQAASSSGSSIASHPCSAMADHTATSYP